MKYAVLKALVAKLQNERKFLRVARTADSVLRLDFESCTYYFDLTRGHNFVSKSERFAPKNYHAPFDGALAKYFTRSNIDKIELDDSDKIIYIHASVKLGYKEQKAVLVFEFTGKNSNVVITDGAGIVLSALRYESNARELKIGQKLTPPPLPPFAFSDIAIDDVDAYLEGLLGEKHAKKLEHLKSQKIAQIDKKIQKLDEALNTLEEPQVLEVQSDEAKKIGDLLCANAHLIEPHQKSVRVSDFDGREVDIELPDFKSQKEILNFFYQKSKKLKKRAEGIHQEERSLGEKRAFLVAQRDAIERSEDEESVKIFAPKPKKSDSKDKDGDIFEVFFKEFKISVGKNRKGNEKLLKFAKANDLWFHIKDVPSAHAILHTAKQNVPDDVVAFAAKVCVELSTDQKGSFLVDFAKRRDVSPVEGAKVNYVNYKTLTVVKE